MKKISILVFSMLMLGSSAVFADGSMLNTERVRQPKLWSCTFTNGRGVEFKGINRIRKAAVMEAKERCLMANSNICDFVGCDLYYLGE